jgi:hypothetical protein
MAIGLAAYLNTSTTRPKLILIKIGVNNYSILVHLFWILNIFICSLCSMLSYNTACIVNVVTTLCTLLMECYNTVYFTDGVLQHCVLY